MKFEHLTLCLASASPRRAELLRQLGIRFEVQPADIDETVAVNEAPGAYVIRMAEQKSRKRWLLNRQSEYADLPVLAADTSVVLSGRVLGKPQDRQHGVEMLTALSGKTHEVLTAVSLVQGEQQRTRVSRSRVTFSRLGQEEISGYWDTGEPLGKAGAYAIQGKAAVFIELLEGSYSGVMGLPLYELGQLLDDLDI